MTHCFLVRRSFRGAATSLQPVFDGRSRFPGGGEMMREHFRLRGRDFGEPIPDRVGYLTVQLTPPLAKHRTVRRVLHQRMLEYVALPGPSVGKDELRPQQLLEGTLQRRVVQRRDGGKQLVGELAPDCRRRLRDVLYRAQPIEARHERIVQGRGNGQSRQRAGQHVGVGLLFEESGFEDGLGQLLDKQRHAVGLLDDLIAHLVGKRLAAQHLFHHRVGEPAAEAVEIERGDVRVIRPGRREFRARGDEGEDPVRADLLDLHGEQVERGGIRPVRVLEDDQHRLPRAEPLELPAQRFEGACLDRLRAHVEAGMAVPDRDRQELGEQRSDRCHIVGAE